MVVLLPVLYFLLDTFRQLTTKTELQTAADAAALAAGRTLVNDRLLTNTSQALANQLALAAGDAGRLAACNNVFGHSVVLDSAGPPTADIVFGRLETPGDNNFQVVDPLGSLPSPVLLLNTVRITARKFRISGGSAIELTFGGNAVAASATVLLDRDVIGFRSVAGQAIPFVPLALLSASQNALSWEAQVEMSPGQDNYQLGPDGNPPFSPGSDGLQEMLVQFNADGTGVNVCPLNIGIADWTGLASQITALAQGGGITSFQVAGQPDLQIVLDANNIWQASMLTAPFDPINDTASLRAALAQLASTGEARVWPLYTQCGNGTATITRFVGARVVKLNDPGNNGAITFLVQPAMLASTSVITDPNRHVNGTVGNPYVCKIRIIR